MFVGNDFLLAEAWGKVESWMYCADLSWSIKLVIGFLIGSYSYEWRTLCKCADK